MIQYQLTQFATRCCLVESLLTLACLEERGYIDKLRITSDVLSCCQAAFVGCHFLRPDGWVADSGALLRYCGYKLQESDRVTAEQLSKNSPQSLFDRHKARYAIAEIKEPTSPSGVHFVVVVTKSDQFVVVADPLYTSREQQPIDRTRIITIRFYA